MYHEDGGVGARDTSMAGSHFCTSSSKLPNRSFRGDTKVTDDELPCEVALQVAGDVFVVE